MIILFTLTSLLEYNQRINPYLEAGEIHNSGLNDIISNIDSDTINELAANYIVTNYTTYVPYAKQSILPIATMGSNVVVNAQNNLLDINLNGGYNIYVKKVFALIATFPPSIAANTTEKSYVIFGDNNSETFDLVGSSFYCNTKNK